jgi:hypothetical protein
MEIVTPLVAVLVQQQRRFNPQFPGMEIVTCYKWSCFSKVWDKPLYLPKSKVLRLGLHAHAAVVPRTRMLPNPVKVANN